MNQSSQQLIRSTAWSYCERFMVQGMQFAVAVYLARLLEPEDYSLLGMLAIFMAIGNCLIHSGYPLALVQSKEVNHQDRCSVFYVNILISLVVYGVLYLCAPLIAQFFREPRLVLLARVLSFNIVIAALGIVASTCLDRRLDFQMHFRISCIASATGGLVAIVMANQGCGVWSLVVQLLCYTVMRTVLLFGANVWRPSLIFSLASLRRLSTYGANMLGISLVREFFDNIYMVVIGRLYPKVTLGYYVRAKKTQQFIAYGVTSSLTRVFYPHLAKLQDNVGLLKHRFRRSMIFVVAIMAPMMLGLACVAQEFTTVVLTEKWLPSVPFLQALCAYGFLYTIFSLHQCLIAAKGCGGLALRLEMAHKVLSFVSILLFYRFGVFYLVLGNVGGTLIYTLLCLSQSARLLHYPFLSQLQDMIPYGLASLAMAGGIYLVSLLTMSVYVKLFAEIVFGIFCYIMLCSQLHFEAMELLPNIFKSIRPANPVDSLPAS